MKNTWSGIRGILTGVFAACVGTAMHQTIVVGFPLGMTLALSTVVILGLHAKKQSPSSWLYASAITIAIVVTGQSSNQDNMIPSSALGLAWGYGAISLALLTALFPKTQRESRARV